MNFIVVVNKAKDCDLIATKLLLNLCDSLGFFYFVEGVDISTISKDIKGDKDDLFKNKLKNNTKFDVLVTIGGDGTILHAANKYNIPILGINLGKVGFLTEVDLGDLQQKLTMLRDGQYTIEHRTTINLNYNTSNYQAINDVVITRGDNSLLDIQVVISDAIVFRYSGDGIIACTPTGSTAYSMAAGGSIISPDTKCFGLTPINPHSFLARAKIVSDESMITIKVLKGQGTLAIDGVKIALMTQGEDILVDKATQCMQFIRFDKPLNSYYKKIFNKLNNL